MRIFSVCDIFNRELHILTILICRWDNHTYAGRPVRWNYYTVSHTIFKLRSTNITVCSHGFVCVCVYVYVCICYLLKTHALVVGRVCVFECVLLRSAHRSSICRSESAHSGQTFWNQSNDGESTAATQICNLSDVWQTLETAQPTVIHSRFKWSSVVSFPASSDGRQKSPIMQLDSKQLHKTPTHTFK